MLTFLEYPFKFAILSTENPSEPFGASVIIDGVTYGTGTASSKKLAKNKAGNSSSLQYWTFDHVVDIGHSLIYKKMMVLY